MFAYLLRNSNRAATGHQYVLLGALVFGLSLVLLGLLPTDIPGKTSIVGQLHGIVFITSVLLQAVLQILIAKNNLSSAAGVFLLVGGIITATGLLAMVLLQDSRGIIQRVVVGMIVVWVTGSTYWLRK